jgi:hypothetical protein
VVIPARAVAPRRHVTDTFASRDGSAEPHEKVFPQAAVSGRQAAALAAHQHDGRLPVKEMRMSKALLGRGVTAGVLVLLVGALAQGCAGSSREAAIASGGSSESGLGADAEQSAQAPEPRNYDRAPAGDRGYPSAAAPSPERSAKKSQGSADDGAYSEESAPPSGAYRRPGLATQWGEARTSHTTETSFERQRGSVPFAELAIRYDDEDGVRAITGLDERYAYPGVFALAGGALTVSLTESDGDPWPALTAGGRNYVIGDEGDRYTIHVNNHSPARFEIVASVDGLDVIDGQDAHYIDGFRSSSQMVQAFRFGEVEDSYAVARGRGADVGVVGVAVFEERGYNVDTRRWNAGNHEPDPFPGRFAQPPGY